MSLSKEERDTIRKGYRGEVGSDLTSCLDGLDEQDKERELAVKLAVIATDKLHAAGLRAKDKEIKRLFAEIDEFRRKLIRLREVLDD